MFPAVPTTTCFMGSGLEAATSRTVVAGPAWSGRSVDGLTRERAGSVQLADSLLFHGSAALLRRSASSPGHRTGVVRVPHRSMKSGTDSEGHGDSDTAPASGGARVWAARVMAVARAATWVASTARQSRKSR